MSPAGPLTIYPGPHGANEIDARYSGWFASDASSLPSQACPAEFKKVRDNHILQSSFDKITGESHIYPSANSFVNGAVTAYSNHQHLEIRPEDVWLSILSQVNIYINAHAEELRDVFVAHEGQKELDIEGEDPEISGGGGGRTNFSVDWGKFSYKMTDLIAKTIKDPTLREWILPSFSTTTELDRAVAAIMMMATLQKYFAYGCVLKCGLPSVTLLGEKSDWEELARRAERLVTFGEEPRQWYGLLKPVLSRFVRSFDAPDAQDTKDFWQKIAHYSSGGSGPTYLSGWITAFCFWNSDGKALYNPERIPSVEREKDYIRYSDYAPVLQLDDVRYHKIESDEVPPGWASVPVKLDDNDNITRCVLVAGLVGMKVTSSGKDLHEKDGVTGLDTISPISGWWMYETKSAEELAEELKAEKKAEAKRWEKIYGRKYPFGEVEEEVE
ncbi:hypothetical protein G7Y89_g11311 [Cudoniella acicularis]|uniref:DUF4419 domain-containing protein n=1 Tax=Cudoniella acicularis TaxID=354080 RepID=A0A8H4VY54_9HELO|nr:hypothetical protein G7Y89_g11311 [Cudoniella acicularis]